MPIFNPDDPFADPAPPKPSKGIDFRKLNTPEAREAAEKSRAEFSAKLEAKQASQKHMAGCLMVMVEDDEITNQWEREFISSVYHRLQTVLPYLTDKQDAILTRLFEKY